MKRYSLWSILSGHPRPYPWRRGWVWVLQHDLCFWLAPRLPLLLTNYIIRDAIGRIAAREGIPAHDPSLAQARALFFARE